MKNYWTLLVVGLLSGAFFARHINQSRAAEADKTARPARIQDASISGLKVPVPGSGETEAALGQKDKELAERDRKLQIREEQLKVEEQRIKARVEELSKLHDDIASLQTQNKKQSAEVLARMVKTFETMAPKKASGVIAAMADDLAVDLFLAMKEKKVAAILEVMEVSRATALSTLIAQRRPAGRAIGEK